MNKENIALKYLADPFTPLLSKDELKEQTVRFIRHLKKHRKALIRNGFIRPLFKGSLWFENFTYNLFLTKNIDHAELKGLKNIEGRIEELRAEFFDLKITLLNDFLLVLSDNKRVGDLWRTCKTTITEKLTRSELQFLMKLEITGRRDVDKYYQSAALLGGLFNLLLMICHYKEELYMGALIRTKLALDHTPKPFLGDNAYLSEDLYTDVVKKYRSYFRSKKQTVEGFIEGVVSRLEKLTRAERDFWVDPKDRLVAKKGKPAVRLGQFALVYQFLREINDNPKEMVSLGCIRGFFQSDYDLYTGKKERFIGPLSGSGLGWKSSKAGVKASGKLHEDILNKNIRHSDDLTHVWCKDELLIFSDAATPVLKKLIDNYFEGNKPVPQASLVHESGRKSKRIKDVFKSTPHWSNLVSTTGNGLFFLSLPTP